MENNTDKFNQEEYDKELDEYTTKTLKMKNEKNFDSFVIKPNTISQFDWSDPEYIKKILEQDFCELKTMSFNAIEYMTSINEHLNVDDFKDTNISPHIISENENYIFEIMYLDLQKNPDEKIKEINNEFAFILDVSDVPIFGNVILQKLFCPFNSTEMYYDSITKKDVIQMMNERIHPRIVIYEDEEWREEELIGPIDLFSEKFFEEKAKIVKEELVFLKHNINIWYVEDEYGEQNVCNKLIENKRMAKCIFFSKITEDRICSLSLNEVNKIKFLSEHMEKYEPTEEDLEEERDDINRIIIKNKYRLLEKYYQKYNT